MTINEILENEEGQVFDRKSVLIEPKALAISVVAFANADGGKIVIGISDKTQRTREGRTEKPRVSYECIYITDDCL